MPSSSATLVIKILSDASGATKGLDQAEGAAGRLSGTMSALGGVIAAGALLKLGTDAVSAASDLQQATGAVEAVFGAYADGVKESAKAAADNVGLSAAKYSELAAVIGSQLKNAGTPMEQLGASTDKLIGLGSDLAAVYGGSVSDAVDAVSSLMRGERDPIERYGVTINQAAIDAEKAAQGLDGLTGAADQQATSQAALKLLFDQTSAAQGQFADQTDTLAEAQQIANAHWDDAQAALGTALLPLLVIAADTLSKLAGWIEENSTLFTILIGILAAVAAAVWLVNFAMAANPIGLIIIAIGLLIAIIVVLVTHWDDLMKACQEVFQSIEDWWNGLMDSFAHGFDQLFGWIDDAIGWWNNLFGAQQAADNSRAAVQFATVGPSTAGVGGMAGFSLVPAPTAAAGRSLSRTSFAPSGATQITNITVQGALDPDRTARQIDGLLTRRGARNGRISAGGGRR